MTGIPMPWHCTTDGVTWPGCGTCGTCRAGARDIFEQARRLQMRYDGIFAVLAKIADLVDAPPGIDQIVKRVEELVNK